MAGWRWMARAPARSVHYPAAETEWQLALLATTTTSPDTSGLALIFSSDALEAGRNITPTLTLSLNTLPLPRRRSRAPAQLRRHHPGAPRRELPFHGGRSALPVGGRIHPGDPAGRAAFASQWRQRRRALPHRPGWRPALPRADDGLRFPRAAGGLNGGHRRLPRRRDSRGRHGDGLQGHPHHARIAHAEPRLTVRRALAGAAD